MSLLDRLRDRFGETPSLDTLIRDVTRWLEGQGCTDIRSFPDRLEIRAQRGDTPHTLHLGNLLRDYLAAPRAERLARVERFLRSVMTEDHRIPTRYAEARAQLMPVVRSAAGMAVTRLSIAQGPDARPDHAPAQRPLAADHVVCLVLDQPDAMAYVSEHSLQEWGVDWDQAYADALDNLRALPEHGGWANLAPGVWSGEWGDAYESSRLLLPDLIYRLDLRDPVVMVPFRHALLVTSASHPQGVEALVRIAHQALDQHGRWVSFELLQLEGRTWQPFTATGPAAALQAQMRLRSQAEDYASQRQVLQGQHEAEGVDLFVADYTLARKDDGPLINYAVWAEGVDTLLPQADTIVMTYKDGEGYWHTRLPWATVQARFGALMEATELVPVRYRVRHFPGRDLLHAVAAECGLD